MTEQYNHFITKQKSLFKSKLDEIHNLYVVANNLYKVISKNKIYLKFIGFNYNKIEKLNNREELYLYDYKGSTFDEAPEILILKANVVTYSNILVKDIPKLKKELEFLSLLIDLPFGAYVDLYSSINRSISAKLLRGKAYYFPKQLGGIQIFNMKRNFKKKVVDYGRSNKLKKQGLKKYIVFHLDDNYTAPKYIKETATVKNYKYYSFKFTKFINTKSRDRFKYYNECTNDEDIINDRKIGNWDKMLALIHLNTRNKYTDYDKRQRKWETYYS